MSKVNGKDAILYKYNETTLEWVPFGCARSITLDISREMVETSISGNGIFKTYVPGAGSVSGNIEGLVFIQDNETTLVTMKSLYDLIIDGTVFNIKYYESDVTNQNYLQKELSVLLESLNETASFDNMATFSANFRGIGAPVVTSGIVFRRVTIGTQTWTVDNFEGTRYLNGDTIPQATSSIEWQDYAETDTGAWCYFNFSTDPYYIGLGKFYNWHAISDARGIGYDGWHIPTQAEWETLKDYGPVNTDLLSLKEVGDEHWSVPNGNNNTGLTLIGSGLVLDDGTTGDLLNAASFWIDEDLGGGYGNGFTYFGYTDPELYAVSALKGYGRSLRFIED